MNRGGHTRRNKPYDGTDEANIAIRAIDEAPDRQAVQKNRNPPLNQQVLNSPNLRVQSGFSDSLVRRLFL